MDNGPSPSRKTAAAGRPPSRKTGRTPSKRRAGPGRPEGISNVRDKILDEAEIEFANLGYAGTSLRNVADRAQVTQALINYYFGSKYKLFEEVFLRRGREVAEERIRRLEALRRSGEPLKVENIVQAFLAPALSLRETEAGKTFMRLQARLHTEPPEISYKLRNEAYHASTRAFGAALQEALPHLPERDVNWRVMLMIGAYLYAFSDTHRLEEMAPGICNPDDIGEMLAAISSFVTGGMLAPSPEDASKGHGNHQPRHRNVKAPADN